jgi:putative protease
MRKPEILSPAGNFEKMKAAILFGADAVYLAGNVFGMRAAADNFNNEELKEAIEYAHARGVKVYVTVNTMPRDDEYPMLRDYIANLALIKPDAAIVADVGVLALFKEIAPEIEIHISTQANAVSAAACRAWYTLGAKRVVLARELTLAEIKNIRKNIPEELELECFIHGSMCVSYSGRCLLSGHMIDRDANRGMCAQPCRWNFRISGYEITEEKRPDIKMPVEEINGETFIMSSKDTCTIEHIPELIEAGINSFKIEGRMKSAYYTAVVTNTYKMALDAYFSGNYEYNPLWLRELESVSHREYAPGYYFKNPKLDANVTSNNGYLNDKAYLAVVTEICEGRVKLGQRNKMSLGDTVEIVTPGKVGRAFKVESLFNDLGEPIESTPHPYMEFFMELPFEAHVGDIIRLG